MVVYVLVPIGDQALALGVVAEAAVRNAVMALGLQETGVRVLRGTFIQGGAKIVISVEQITITSIVLILLKNGDATQVEILEATHLPHAATVCIIDINKTPSDHRRKIISVSSIHLMVLGVSETLNIRSRLGLTGHRITTAEIHMKGTKPLDPLIARGIHPIQLQILIRGLHKTWRKKRSEISFTITCYVGDIN